MSAPRELSVTYAGVTISGQGDDAHLDGPVLAVRNYDTVTVSFRCTIFDLVSASAFEAAHAALMTAFHTPRGDLVVSLSGQELHSFSHSANTGMNGRPSIRELEANHSGRSRSYLVEVTFQTPADLSGQAGLRDATTALTVDRFGVQTVAISGRYTALSGNGARAQHDANVSTFCEAQLDLIDNGVTWLQLERPVEVSDDSDKNLEFRRIYVDRLPVTVLDKTDAASRKSFVMVGAFQDAGSGARAAYAAGIATLVTAAQAAVDSDADWERVDAEVFTDDGDAYLTFTHVYQEIIDAQAQGTTDDAELKAPSIIIQRLDSAPGDSSTSARRPLRLLVTYSAAVDQTQSTDLLNVWNNKVKPRLRAHVAALSGAAQLALEVDAPAPSPTGNRLQGTQVWIAVVQGNLMASELAVRDARSSGETILPVWDERDPYAADIVPAPITHIRTIVRIERQVVSSEHEPGYNPPQQIPTMRSQESEDGFRVVYHSVPNAVRRIRGLGGDQFIERTITEVQVLRKVTQGGPAGTRARGEPAGGASIVTSTPRK